MRTIYINRIKQIKTFTFQEIQKPYLQTSKHVVK